MQSREVQPMPVTIVSPTNAKELTITDKIEKDISDLFEMQRAACRYL